MLDHPGFNGTYFQTFDGVAVSPAGRPAGLSVNAEARTGAVDEDRVNAARKLFAAIHGHWICEFALGLGFAALVKAFAGMPRQPVILFCGGPEADTSVLLDLTAWAAGAPLGHPDGQYALALDQNATGLNEALNGYRDHAIVIDPSGYFSKVESKKTLLAKWTILAHVLSSGHVRTRGGPAPVSRSFVAALSADSSGQDLINSKPGDGGEFDGMYRTRVDEPFGLFSQRAEAQGGAAALQAEIAGLIRDSYGAALPRFAQWLVDYAARDRAGLKVRIERLREVFREKVGASDKGDLARRIADTFSLFYATAVLLRASGVVPKSFRTAQPIAKAYRACLEAMSPPKSGRERLMELAGTTGIIDLRVEDRREMTNEELKAVPAFLDVSEANELLLLMTVDGLARALRDYRFVLKDPEVRAMMIPDSDQDKPKHPVRKGKRDRVYRFNLGPIDATPTTSPDLTLFDAVPVADPAARTTEAARSMAGPEKEQPRPEFVGKRKAKAAAARRATAAQDRETAAKGAGKGKPRPAGEQASKAPKLKVGARVRVTNPATAKTRIGEIVEVEPKRARIAWRTGKTAWVARSKVALAPKRKAA